MLNYEITLPGSGFKDFLIPGKYKYCTVLNDQNYFFTLYRGTAVNADNKIADIMPYNYLPIPLTSQNQQQQYVLGWTGTATGRIVVIFSELSLGVGQPLIHPSSLTHIVGAIPDGGTASENPVLIAGLYSETPATREDGEVATLQTDAQGRILITIQDSAIQVPMEIQAHSLTNENPIPIVLSDSDIQVPIEIQAHSLLNTTPIPVYASKIEAYNVVAVALAENELWLSSIIDMTNKKLIYGQLQVTETGATYSHQYSNDGVNFLSSAANSITADTLVSAPGLTVGSKYYRLAIQNGATANVLTAFASTFSV